MPSRAADAVHVLRHPSEDVSADTLAQAGQATLTTAGSTAHFTVRYDAGLGPSGEVLARAVLDSCEADYARVQAWFGGLTPSGLPFTSLIGPGSFGAYHAGCADTTLHLAAFDATDGELVEMVNMAEVVEVFSADQNVGWDCGASNGEGLSRVLATELHPSQLDGFATAAAWLDSDRPNFVDPTDPTDQNAVSTGCAVLFLNYLRHQLGFDWADIVTHGQPTLAATARALTGGKQGGWADFSELIAVHFPPGVRSQVSGDNVFPL